MYQTKRKKVISLDIFTFSCDGCGKCIYKCPQNVLKMINNGYCQFIVVSSVENCTGCGKCERICKRSALKLTTL